MAHEATHKDQQVEYYSKTRIAKIAFINVVLTISALVYISAIFLSIVLRSSTFIPINVATISILLTYFITSLLVAYGSGLYIISIIKEQFTTKSLRLHPEYRILYITNQFFHGPVSHVYIYSGGLVLFFLISLFEMLDLNLYIPSVKEIVIYIISGVFAGSTLLAAQINNLTWKHQMPYMCSILFIYLFTIIYFPIDILKHPFNIFFLITSSITGFGLLFKHIIFKVLKQIYKYDKLGKI
jgi:hypothetical protein